MQQQTSMKYHALWIMLAMSFYFICGSVIAAQVSGVKQDIVNDKVLIVVSSDKHGYWLPEVLEPYQILQKAGFEIDIASPKGGEGAARGSSRLSNKQVKWFENSTLQNKLLNSMPLAIIDSNQYIAIYFAGGAGPMFDLVNEYDAQRVTREIYEAGGIVSADCHGPAALLNVKLSNGQHLIADKEVTGKANIEEGRWARSNYTFLLEDKLTEVSKKYSAKGKGRVHVVVDQRVITGQNPASAAPMAEALVSQLSLLK